jgi:hypothetical protein
MPCSFDPAKQGTITELEPSGGGSISPEGQSKRPGGGGSVLPECQSKNGSGWVNITGMVGQLRRNGGSTWSGIRTVPR